MVGPIRRSAAIDALVFGLLMILVLLIVIFLYGRQHQREYATLRALGVPKKQTAQQLILPLLLFGGLGILLGGASSWNFALGRAKANLSTLPTPAGVTPSADLNPLFLAAACLIIFFFLAAFSWLGIQTLSRKTIFDLLQGRASSLAGKQKRADNPPASSSSPRQNGVSDNAPDATNADTIRLIEPTGHREYTPFFLSQFVFLQGLRSRGKSILTLAVALGFMLASGWVLRTLERSQAEIQHLYDTTVVEADVFPADPSDTTSLGPFFTAMALSN